MIIKTMMNLFLKFSFTKSQVIRRIGVEAGSHLERELGWIDSFSWPNEITQQGYDYGNPALWNSYQQGDKRKLLTIVGPGDQLVSPGIIAKWGGIKGYPPVVAGFACR